MSVEFDNETVIQSQVEHALVVWMRTHARYRYFRPANSTQGANFNDFAGDLMAIIQDCHLLLLEFKAKHPRTHLIQRFKPDQYQANLRLWSESVPIRYAYSTQPAVSSWHLNPLRELWLLKAINQSPPPKLGTTAEEAQYADVDNHGSLLDYLLELLDSEGSPSLARLALACGAALGAHHMRNGVLLLLVSKRSKAYAALNGTQLKEFHNWVIEQNHGLPSSAYEAKAAQMALTPNPFPASEISQIAAEMERGFNMYMVNVDPDPAPEGNDDDPQGPKDRSIVDLAGAPDVLPPGSKSKSSNLKPF